MFSLSFFDKDLDFDDKNIEIPVLTRPRFIALFFIELFPSLALLLQLRFGEPVSRLLLFSYSREKVMERPEASSVKPAVFICMPPGTWGLRT